MDVDLEMQDEDRAWKEGLQTTFTRDEGPAERCDWTEDLAANRYTGDW